MATRSGGFGIPGGLDPFGGARGGLGRYNLGSDIGTLAQAEAYEVYIRWANGQASDEEYLASLQHMVDLSNPGTSERVTAENRLHDAKYTIGRNELVKTVNDANSPAARQAALERLLTYDTAHLGTMTAHDSQAYRDQLERVTSTRVEIRQSRYSALVDKVNRGHASTDELLALARALGREAGDDPDKDDWQNTIETLTDRVSDEKLADAFQSYQHHRMSGDKVLAMLNARIAQVDPGSPAYKELVRQREDLKDRLKTETANIREQKIAGQRQQGKLSDAGFLSYLRDVYNNEDAGTAEKIAAGNRLREFTFSLAEDKLRYDVMRGARPRSALIAFYRKYLQGMNPNSERYRQLMTAIRTLGGGAGGGGGGGKGKGKGGIGLGPKLITGISAMEDLLTVGPDGKRIKPPPDFAGLFQLDIRSTTAAKWWSNNLREMTHAASEGLATWTYHDKSGREYQMPFEPDMMGQMDHMNVAYMREGLRTAKTAKQIQTWTGKLITATNALSAHASAFTMKLYTRNMEEMNAAKERALAGGRYAEYVNLVGQQQAWIRKVLGIPDGAPTDINLAQNPYLSASESARIGRDLERLAPQNFDQTDEVGYAPDGDPVLAAVRDGAIVVHADPGTGEALSAELDPNRGYVTLDKHGNVVFIPVDPTDDSQWQTNTDPRTGEPIKSPAYLSQTVAVTVRINGEDAVVRQPITMPPDSPQASYALQGLPVYRIDHNGDINKAILAAFGIPLPVVRSDNKIATLPVMQTYTVEGSTTYTWVSLDGKTWIRYDPRLGVTPRIVLPDNVTLSAEGKWQINGKDASPAAIIPLVHFWGQGGENNPNVGGSGGIGGPGQSFITRTVGPDGTIDLRPENIVQFERLTAAEIRGADAGLKAEVVGARSPEPDEPRTEWAQTSGELLPPSLRGPRVQHDFTDPRRTYNNRRELPDLPGVPRPRELTGTIKPPDPTLKPPPTPDLAEIASVVTGATKLLDGIKLPALAPLAKIAETVLKPVVPPKLPPVKKAPPPAKKHTNPDKGRNIDREDKTPEPPRNPIDTTRPTGSHRI